MLQAGHLRLSDAVYVTVWATNASRLARVDLEFQNPEGRHLLAFSLDARTAERLISALAYGASYSGLLDQAAAARISREIERRVGP
jgi:hypothetical protein